MADLPLTMPASDGGEGQPGYQGGCCHTDGDINAGEMRPV